MRKVILALLLAAPLSAWAQLSPVGTWQTIDDRTGKPKSIVEIYQKSDGTLAGKVQRVLQSDKGPHPICDACKGDKRNKPIEGMEILWGVRRKNEGNWGGGQILDPKDGKIYSVKIRPAANGQKLEVRGFMGVSLFGRTQTWVRK